MSRTQMRALTISPHYLLVALALALLAAVAFAALPFRQAEAGYQRDFQWKSNGGDLGQRCH